MAQPRHKREKPAPRFPRSSILAAPLAALATLGVVGVGVVGADVPAPSPANLAGAAYADVDLGDRTAVLSRSAERRVAKKVRGQMDTAATAAAAAAVITDRVVRRAKEVRTKLWTTAPLNIWTSPDDDARDIGEFEEGKQILVTGRRENGRVEVVVKGVSRWVSEGYLSKEKPQPGLGGSCSNGSSVSPGVGASIVKVHQAVCAAFPDVTSYGTLRGGGGDHGGGLAVDIMVSGARGWQVAEFVRENYAALGVSYVIYSQRIWSVQRSGEGWRAMSSRGSITANHYDHVHVSTY